MWVNVSRRLDAARVVSHDLCVSTLPSAWTPGRIASVGVLALALGALVVDKAFLGQSDPSSASADQVAPQSASPSGAGVAAPAETLAHRLERHRAQATAAAGEAFVTPPGFFPSAAKHGESEQAPAAAPVAQIAWPRLSAVVMGTSPGAILDGRLQRQGESVGGFELVSVAERSVTVRQGEHETVLTLDEAHR